MYFEPWQNYAKNKDQFQRAVNCLREAVETINDVEIKEVGEDCTGPLQMRIEMYGDEIEVTLYQRVLNAEIGSNPDYLEEGTGKYGYYYTYSDIPIALSLTEDPALHKALSDLKTAGITSIDYYDFSREERYASPSPCEILFLYNGKYIIYSETEKLTTGYDMMDGSGYGINSRVIDKDWLAADSYYDRDSDYWKG